MKKFKVHITNYSHLEVEAEDWETAKRTIEDRLNDADGLDRDTSWNINDNSTHWFVDHVEELFFYQGDAVTCSGEGDKVFTLSKVDYLLKRAYLLGPDNEDITGWKSLDQLQKVD